MTTEQIKNLFFKVCGKLYEQILLFFFNQCKMTIKKHAIENSKSNP